MLRFSDKRRSCRIAFFSILYSWQWPHKGLNEEWQGGLTNKDCAILCPQARRKQVILDTVENLIPGDELITTKAGRKRSRILEKKKTPCRSKPKGNNDIDPDISFQCTLKTYTHIEARSHTSTQTHRQSRKRWRRPSMDDFLLGDRLPRLTHILTRSRV